MASKTFAKSPDDDSCVGLSDSDEVTVTESMLGEDFYEGVEKKLILKYTGDRNVSIRETITEKVWRSVVQAVDADILSIMRNDYVDAYLLSESSLFVFKDRIFLKTCGTTRIFNAVDVIVTHVAKEIPEIDLTGIMYSRPTFRFPKRQLEGYRQGFKKEVELLRGVTMEATTGSWKSRIHTTGKGITFHSATLYQVGMPVKPFITTGNVENGLHTQENLNMDLAMFNLDSSKMTYFFGKQENVLENSCLRGFLPQDSPSFQIDDYNFQPCGYSLNALDGEYFWCIHITPEDEYSYLSFETNHPSAPDTYKKLKDFYAPQSAIILWTDENLDDYNSIIN